jgi:ABC-type multidrug transport system fused ATPase/permease subunit
VTFLSYLSENRKNYGVFALTLLSYIASETLYALFVLFLNNYDAVKEGTDPTFSSLSSFWVTLTIMSAATVLFQIVRVFLLNLCLQLANESLHNRTLEHVFKAQVLEVDRMGTKEIMDKYSADLGLLDAGTLPFLSGQFIVGTVCCIQVVTIALVNPIILPFAFCLALPLFLWYLYCNDTL